YFRHASVAEDHRPLARHVGERLASVAHFHWSTGNLTTATYGTDVALTGAGNQRAQQILPDVYGDGSILKYLNINAFQAPATAPKGVYATTRPFTISGPNVMNIDLSLSRNFKIRERGTITFRAEAFNLTNSTMYGF